MALAYLLDPNKQYQDVNGVNNVSGFLRVYYEGTDDRATTYKNFIGTMNPADIPIDNCGRAVVIVEDEKTYRLEVYSRNGNLMWTQHPLCALVGGGGSFEQVQSNWNENDPTSAAFIKNKPDLGNFLEKDGDGKDVTVTFSEASERTEIRTGDTLSALFGKIKKFFTDLAAVAFTGSYDDLSDKPSIPAAQVNSDWNANSGVAEILNKPDLSQYIPSIQKGAANGVGTLDANGVQPYSETYKGYYNSADTSSKVIKIGRFKTGSDTRDAGGVSFSIVYRGPTDKSSGQILVWLSTHNVDTITKCYKTVLFNRGEGIDDNIIKVYTHSVTESSVNYVDLYATIGTWCSVRIVPLWGNPDTWTPAFTTASLPSGATEVSNTIFVKSEGAAGSVSVPVYIDNAGNAVACTMATVASTGSYNDLSNKPDLTRVISSDGSDPMSAPPIAGITFINKSTHDIWYASGTTSTSDWTLIYNRNHDLICQQKPIVISGSTTMRYILCDRQKYTIENGAYVFAPVDIYELAKWINRGDVIQIDGATAYDPWGDRYPMRITEMQCSLDISTNKRYCTNIRCSGYTHVQTETTRWGDNITDEATGTTYMEFQNWT